MKVESHNCAGTLPSCAYGEAIYDCTEDENSKLWVGNGEYASQVNFCPYCGFKARVLAKELNEKKEVVEK